MDSDRKTLAELSSEVKEKKYVTLEVGSKISGYTPEYLDRLCRLDKVEHGLLAKGGFALELQSLLRETHTILISDIGIVFVEDKDLVALPHVKVGTVPPSASQGASAIPSAVGVPKEPYVAVTPHVPHKPVSLPPVQVLPRQTFTPPATSPAQGEESVQSSASVGRPAREQDFEAPPEVDDSFTPAVSPQVETARSSFIPSAPVTASRPEPAPGDEWDALLLGGVENEKKEDPATTSSSTPSSYEIPSVYRPVRTSIDPSPHHDPAPLFSFSKKNDTGILGVPVQTTVPAFAGISPPVPISESVRKQLVAVSPTEATNEQRVLPPTPPLSPDPRGKILSSFSPPLVVAAKSSPELSRPPLPAMRVMPQNQKTTEEHHLTIPESHSLTKSIVLRTFFAFLVASSVFLLLSEIFPDTTEALLAGSRTLYVAGVDLASPENRAMLP